MDSKRNCLSYWLPKLEEAAIPTPRTIIVPCKINLFELIDGTQPAGFQEFLSDLTAAADHIGEPCFLRTGQTSGKHQWDNTCHLTNLRHLARYVGNLVEYSELAGIMGLPYDVWVVRELLPVQPICTLKRYCNFPLVREARCFIKGGKVVCHHPYWPHDAIRDGMFSKTRQLLKEESTLIDHLYAEACELPWEPIVDLAGKVAEVFADDGSWSVDILETQRGWFVTDMAVARQSFHWPDCEFFLRGDFEDDTSRPDQ
jgi:hypothetical protein